MKRILLSGVAALLLVACSGEDPAAVDTTTKNLPTEKELNTVTEYSGGVYTFDNNKVIKFEMYNNEWFYENTYNENGELSVVILKNAAGQIGSRREINYDENNRIISRNDVIYYMNDDRTITEDVVYTYNSDNSVTVTMDNSKEGAEARTYYFDTAGKVVKVTKDGYVQQEILYEGNNINKINDLNFTYDLAMPVKGQYLNMYRNQFATYSNFVLYTGYLVPNAFSDKFIVSTDGPHGSDDYNYEYEFDEEGYPISQTVSNLLNESSSTVIITYK